MLLFHLGFVLVTEGKECSGREILKGRFHTLAECATICKSVSTMFVYGRQGNNGCHKDGCACYCELDANEDMTCHEKDHPEFNLYRYSEKSTCSVFRD